MTRDWPWRRLAWAAVIAGIALRLAFALGYWQGKPLTHDEQEYLSLAANLAAGRGFTSHLPAEPRHPLVDEFGRAPLYPAFLAPLVARDTDLGAGRLPPQVPRTVQVAQAVLGGVLVWCVGALARRAAGEPAAALAALGAAVHPALVWIPAYALSETLYAVVALSLVWLLGAVIDPIARRGARITRHATGLVALAGIVAGLGVLTRPALLVLLPMAAVAVWKRTGLATAVLFAVLAALTVAPWTMRNYAVHGRMVLVASEGGVTFWTGNHALATGEGDMAANPPLKRANQALRAANAGMSPEALERVYYREAFAWIRQHPLDWAVLTARKAFFTVVPLGPSYRLHSPLYFWASIVPYVLLLPVAIAGALRLRHAAAPPVALGLAVAASFVVCLVFFPQERFRIPVVDPALIVAAACWMAPSAWPAGARWESA